MNPTLCIALSAILVVSLYSCSATDPGIKVRITKNGIDFANQVAHDEIVTALQTLSIPDQSGSEHHFSYTLTNIQVRSVTPPDSAIALSPNNAVTWSLSNFGIKIYLDWRVKYENGIVKISDSGSVDASLSGVNLVETAAFGIDNTGRPSISSVNCDDSIGDVDLDFHGGSSFIINLFKHSLEDKVKDFLTPKICDEVTEFINVDAQQRLATMPVSVEIAKKFLLQYSLVSAPAVTDDYVEISDKGEIVWEADPQESPFVPQPIPPWTDNSRMVYIWVTTYAPNTFFYQGHTHGFLMYNVTKEDLPPANASFLNTTCGPVQCIGSIIPQIGKMYPNSTVEFRLQTSAVPNTTATTSAVTAEFPVQVDMYAHTPEGKVPFLVSLSVNTSLTFNATIKDQKLTGTITDYSSKLKIIKSAVGQLSETVLNVALNGVLYFVVIPQLNDIAAEGIVLPMVQGVEFSNTILLLQQGDIVIGTDLQRQTFPDRFR